MKPTLKQLQEFATYVEQLSHLPLVERVFLWTTFAKQRGLDVFARTAAYLAVASGSSTAAEYTLDLTRADAGGLHPEFLLHELEHPSNGTADILFSSIKCNGNEHVTSDAIADAWCDALSSEDPRSLPWPIIVPGNSQLIARVSGSSLNTTGLKASGFHVDELTASVFRYVGELEVEGYNRTYAAAAIMSTDIDRKRLLPPKQLSHIVAKETLTGDAARSSLEILIKAIPAIPKRQAVIPPLSLRKAAARVNIGIDTNDSIVVLSRYTSAGGAGTAKLQVTALARRRFTVPDCAA